MSRLASLCLCLCLTLPSAFAKAGPIEVNVSPDPSTPVQVGQTVTLQVQASYREPNDVVGGAFNLAYDPRLLALAGPVQVNEALTDVLGVSGVHDPLTGTVSGIGFATFAGASGDFTLASLVFEAIALGTSDILLSDAQDPLFAWADSDGGTVTPSFAAGAVVVSDAPIVVPEPVTLALLLGGLGVLACRHRTTTR